MYLNCGDMRKTDCDRTVQAVSTMTEPVPLRLIRCQANDFNRRDLSVLAKATKYSSDPLVSRTELFVVIEDTMTACPLQGLYFMNA
jgi:hypothetical protein